MFRWLALLLREKLEVYYRRINERSQRVAAHSKTKPFRPTVKLGLEGLEDRVVPSVAATVPPPAVPSVASIVSPPEIPVVTAAATLYNDAIKTVETAISTYQHLGDTIRARLEAALHHHHTITPFLPPAAPPQMTIWTWTPTQAGNLASDPRNWLLNGNPQGKNGSLPNGPDSEALFEGNDPIVWDTNLVFAQMALGRTNGAAYTGQQTIKANVIVEMTGGPNIPAMVQNVTGNVLSVYFDDATSVFQIDANATTSNVVLNGNPKGTFNIAGGTTTFAPSGAFEDNIGASMSSEPTASSTI